MSNRIPRNFKTILATPLFGAVNGKQMEITKDEHGYHGRELATGKEWSIFVAHLRNENCFRIDSIVK